MLKNIESKQQDLTQFINENGTYEIPNTDISKKKRETVYQNFSTLTDDT